MVPMRMHIEPARTFTRGLPLTAAAMLAQWRRANAFVGSSNDPLHRQSSQDRRMAPADGARVAQANHNLPQIQDALNSIGLNISTVPPASAAVVLPAIAAGGYRAIVERFQGIVDEQQQAIKSEKMDLTSAGLETSGRVPMALADLVAPGATARTTTGAVAAILGDPHSLAAIVDTGNASRTYLVVLRDAATSRAFV